MPGEGKEFKIHGQKRERMSDQDGLKKICITDPDPDFPNEVRTGDLILAGKQTARDLPIQGVTLGVSQNDTDDRFAFHSSLLRSEAGFTLSHALRTLGQKRRLSLTEGRSGRRFIQIEHLAIQAMPSSKAVFSPFPERLSNQFVN